MSYEFERTNDGLTLETLAQISEPHAPFGGASGSERAEAVKIIDYASELFGENGEHWTQRAFARDRDGDIVDPRSQDAVSYCAKGAVLRSAHYLQGKGAIADWKNSRCAVALILTELDVIGSVTLAYWNDTLAENGRKVRSTYESIVAWERIPAALDLAAAYIGADGRGWIRGVTAADKRGLSVFYNDEEAVQWSLKGAVLRACDHFRLNDAASSRAMELVELRLDVAVDDWEDKLPRRNAGMRVYRMLRDCAW